MAATGESWASETLMADQADTISIHGILTPPKSVSCPKLIQQEVQNINAIEGKIKSIQNI